MTVSVNIGALFDADALHDSGECPWTIFAYPTDIADSRGLAPDDDAQMLLAELQSRGISMSLWVNGITENTTFFACRYVDRDRVNAIVNELENLGILDENFLSTRSDYVFSLGNSST
ncbi:MAG: hypothetical protein JNL58_00995 [Planctomyces sp.]|nr:hypothetical protein [Planctomyces sp.]